MAALIHLDTHVVAWLYAGRADLLSRRAALAIEEEDLAISPMVVLELEYLRETKRLAVSGPAIVRALETQIGLRVSEHGFNTIIRSALDQDWTRDPFDRIIVGHAIAAACGLVTKDRSIRRRYDRAVW